MDDNKPSEFNAKNRQQIEQYKVAFDSLRDSVSSLGKPLTAISNSINALDRDLSKFTDTIAKLNTQNATLSSSNDKVKKSITDISSSFSSWNSIINLLSDSLGGWGIALSAGLSVLTVYSDGILKWIDGMLKGTTTLSALGKVMKDNAIIANSLIETKLQGSQAAQREITDLNVLYKATQDHNLSLRQKKAAVSALKDQWPDTFKNISDETIMAGKAAGAYKNLKDQILAASYAEAAKNKITENASRILENEQKVANERAKNLKIVANQKSLTNEANNDDDRLDESGIRLRNYNDKLDKIKTSRAASDKIIYDLHTDTDLLSAQNERLYQEIEKRVKLFGVSVTGHKTASASHSTPKKTQSGSSNTDKPDPTQQLEAMGINFAQKIALEKKNYDTEQAALDDQLKNKLISQEDYEKQSQQLKDQYHQNVGAKVKDFNEVDFDSAKKNLQDIVQLNAESQQKISDDAKKHTQERKDFELQAAQQVSNAAFSILQNSIKSQSDAKVKQLETQKQSELNNSSLTASQKQAIEDKYKKKEAEVKVKAFKDEQKASILQAVINGALAVTKATAQTGALSAFVIPGIIAETAIQVATIASQKPPQYAKGGIHYRSDGKGALLSGYSRTDNTNAYLRSGEAIVVSEAMRDPWARNLVSAINVAYGGRDFSVTNPTRGYAIGGIFTDGGNSNRYYNQPVNDQKDLANTIAYQMINNFPPVYVDVKDVNNQQNILAQTINRVNL